METRQTTEYILSQATATLGQDRSHHVGRPPQGLMRRPRGLVIFSPSTEQSTNWHRGPASAAPLVPNKPRWSSSKRDYRPMARLAPLARFSGRADTSTPFAAAVRSECCLTSDEKKKHETLDGSNASFDVAYLVFVEQPKERAVCVSPVASSAEVKGTPGTHVLVQVTTLAAAVQAKYE
ncbi:hypothetical protein JX265_001575 [Neoarthrinium moseri]|uniref:Uncharacterized protein n=1 Tax=Neoarthrinium moseri TaxID=1658444 RepID=A0A9P9WVB2_9PEZI|nr:hypothetical protein JX265_001575 [Neoarthrinium moseri]